MDTVELQQLIDAHYARIRRAAMGLCNDPWEADEIAQETFLAAQRGITQLRQPASAGVWLYGICVRIHRSRFRSLVRRARRMTQWGAQAVRTDWLAYESQSEHQQWREGIWGCVSRLPRRQREVIVLRFVENMTQAQIAVALGCSEGTVKSRLHYGLRRLKEQLGRDGQLRHVHLPVSEKKLPEELVADIINPQSTVSP